jgi:DEP domain-containing protein 5
MSSEMWEFDVNGEMYHEKAINFLSELFTNWKNQTCQHDVTITLFSRVFYDAKTIDEFPSATQACIHQDHRNRFYEDFYRVIYQNKRYDDWMFALINLKRLIKEYREYVSQYHERYQYDIVPRCKLSNSAEGNFLETVSSFYSI